MRKGLLTRFNIVLVFIWFFFLVYLSYGKSLGLSLYGDDWLVISKYFGAYGPGRRYPYLHLDLLTTNYGPQYVGMAILYKLFGSWALPYYIVSFVTRALCALAIYWFANRLTKNRFAGLAAGSLFAISVVGAETTDWVYNMNSYVGVGLSLIGLGLFLYADNLIKKFVSWFFLILGYMIVIIRLFILPVAISFLVFSKSLFFSSKRVGVNRVLISFVKLILAVSPFLILKHYFPGLGFQKINAVLLTNGLQRAQGLVAEWKFDWLLIPFTMIGSYIFPGVFESIKGLGWGIYPVKDFVLYGSSLGLFGAFFLYVMLRSYQKRFAFIFSFFISFTLLFLLKLYFHYQGPSLLKEFDRFSQTFVGIIFFFSLAFSTWRFLKRKNVGLFSLNLVGFFYTFSMLFPWGYNPESIKLPPPQIQHCSFSWFIFDFGKCLCDE